MLKSVAMGVIYCCHGQSVFTLVVHISIYYCSNKLHLLLSRSLTDLIDNSIFHLLSLGTEQVYGHHCCHKNILFTAVMETGHLFIYLFQRQNY